MMALSTFRQLRCTVGHRHTRAFPLRAASDQARVTLKVPLHLEFGDRMAIAGLDGAWDLNSALSLSWTEGDVWVGETSLPTG
jgi:hypothetical protein